MTRTGALLWKEGRDHRASLLVMAGLVPLACWPIQRWVFKFAEPEWTWKWLLPFAVGIVLAVLAADLFAMDIATSRMTTFAALPVPVRRHFGARALFLALVGASFAAWTAAANLAIVGIWGKPDAALVHLDEWAVTETGAVLVAATTAAVVLVSALGVGGFRAVLGGLAVAAGGCGAAWYAASRLVPRTPYESVGAHYVAAVFAAAAVVLAAAAYAGFVGGRAHAVSRRRGAALAATVLVVAFGTPGAFGAWRVWRSFRLSPTDPEITLERPVASPDERFLAFYARKENDLNGTSYRSWILRVEDGRLFDWPRFGEIAAGWTKDGLVWAGRMDWTDKSADYGRFVRPDTGETVEAAAKTEFPGRMASGYVLGPSWAQWLRYDWLSQKCAQGCSMLRLHVKDGELERVVEARGMPAATPEVGRALYVTADKRLALVDLAGGEPRIVAEDATGVSWLSCSPDGRFYVVSTSKGTVVLDGATWRAVVGPFDGKLGVWWCGGAETRAVLSVTDAKGEKLDRLVDVAAGREIVPDASLDVLAGYQSVLALADGRLVARAGTNRLLLLDADGKLIRRLFPPEE